MINMKKYKIVTLLECGIGLQGDKMIICSPELQNLLKNKTGQDITENDFDLELVDGVEVATILPETEKEGEVPQVFKDVEEENESLDSIMQRKKEALMKKIASDASQFVNFSEYSSSYSKPKPKKSPYRSSYPLSSDLIPKEKPAKKSYEPHTGVNPLTGANESYVEYLVRTNQL